MEGPNTGREDDRRAAAAAGRNEAARANGGTVRPPGPEERRGAVAASDGAGGNGQRPSLRNALRSPRFWITVLVLSLLNWFLAPMIFPEPQERVPISYTLFKQQVDAGNVAEITSRGDTVQGEFKTPVPEPNPPSGRSPRTIAKFETNIPTFVDREALGTLLEQRGVQISARPLEEGRASWLSLLLAFGPTLLLIGGFLWISGRAAGVGRMLGASRARRYDPGSNTPQVTFADVAGIDGWRTSWWRSWTS
jgi:cell division protease FtsH